MAHPQTANGNPEYCLLVEDTFTQKTDRNFNVLEQTRDASTQTTEEYISEETTLDASTQTPNVDSGFLEQPPTTSESRNRNMPNEQEVIHGSDACKLPRTEICGISGNENPGYNVLLEHSLRTSRDGRTLTTEEFISQETPGGTSTLTPEDYLCFLEQPAVTSEESRKRNISNEQEVTHGSDSCKLPRTEICGISGNENNVHTIPGYNVLLEHSLRTSRDGRTLTDEEYYSQEETQDARMHTLEVDLSFLDQLPTTSETPEESKQRKITNEQEVTHGSDTCKLPRTEFCGIDNENLLYNVLLEHPLRTSRDRRTLTTEEFISRPAPSKSSEESRKRKISNVQNMTHGSDNCKLLKTETDQEHLRCSVCKKTKSEHVEVHDGKVMYKCCRCPFNIRNFNYLQMHIYDEHSKPFYCIVCQMKYLKKGLHAYGGTCDVCMQNFECKFELEEHHFYFSMSFFNSNA